MNKRLAKLQKELDISDTHNMPSTDIILKNVNNKINVSPEERKIYMKRKYLKITSIAAVICALAVTTAFAADSISGKIGEIISYFQNDNAVEMTSLEQLANFNDSIGKSISKDGYTLTLDNVAADDNFVHVFYTVTSENEPFYNNSDNNAPIWSNSLNVSADIQCVINGKLTGVSNNNHENGYFVDQHTYKCAKKYNVSGYNIPNKFNLELFAFISKADTSEENFPVAFTKLLNGQYDGITDDDKNSVWYISTDIDKSKVKVSSITKDINLKLPNSDATVEKAVFFERFTSFLERELKAGGTLYGIHRDDMTIKVNEKEARSFAETFISEGKNRLIEETKSKMSLDDLFSQIQSGNVKELDIIVKADVQGSVEAVKQSLEKLSNEEVVVKVIHGGVGAINESDVSLASASNAIIIGFNVRPDPMAKTTADKENVDMRLYKVIYNAIEDVEAAMKGMLDPIFEEKVLGHAEVRQIFKASGIGNIAGSYVLDGVFQRGCKVRISREGTQIFEGNLASLKRFKDDVKEVKAGYECGLVFEGFNDIAELDIVEAYTMVEVPR